MWVTPQLPSLHTGAQVRQYYLIRELSQRHQLRLISFFRKEEQSDLRALQDCGVELMANLFAPPDRRRGWKNRWQSWSQVIFDQKPHFSYTYPIERLKPLLEEALAEQSWDIVQFDSLYSAPLSAWIGSHPWILTAHNVETLNAFSQAKLEKRVTYRLMAELEVRKLIKWERYWVERSNACVTVSELDAERLVKMASKGKYFVIPNGVDAQAFKPTPLNNRIKNRIVFFGNLGYPPNITGLRWFMDKVFVQLKEKNPDISFEIIGAHAPKEILEYERYPGVKFTGYVGDIRPYLWNAEICVVPLLSGGGTRLKILEAMAAGCAIVTTSVGIEGLIFANEIDYLMADDPRSFSQQLTRLIVNPDLRRRISSNALEKVKTVYDWKVIAPRLEEVFTSICDTNLS